MTVELSDRELLSIGKIVALWGSLEYEIFFQTAMTLTDLPDGHRLKGNEQFSELLTLWETHVVDKATGLHKEVLQRQCQNIRYHQDFRNALVHGMWEWSDAAPGKITATRIRKKEVNRTTFTADGLESFAIELARIAFNVKYPGGIEQYAQEMADGVSSLSRRGFALMFGDSQMMNDLFPGVLLDTNQE